MATENFTTYTEVDTNNRLSETASRVTCVATVANEETYLYKDFNANHFDALSIDFEIYCASQPTYPYGRGGIGISNTLASSYEFASTDVSAFAMARPLGVCWIWIDRGADIAYDYYIGLTDTLYYCTLSRPTGNDTVTLTIYQDATRLVQLASLPITGFGTVKWQYAFGFAGANSGDADRLFDGYVQNMDLKETTAYSSQIIIMGE